jgi:thiamine-phosphate pyrophosphorylase
MSLSNKKIIRVLDANANRCREGLRVVEDMARFVLARSREAALAKHLRHQVTLGMKNLGLGRSALLAQRDAEADVGRASWSLSESRRRNLQDILACNLHRVQEAARVLEEFGKVVNPRAARIFKNARYEAYTLEKKLLIRPRGRKLETQL